MHIPGTGRLKAMARRAGNRLTPRPLILLYHRVTGLERDPQELAVTQVHFAEQLRVLKEQASVISLGELWQRMPTGRWPRRAVVITFDDGYADNLAEALPLLKKQKMPATFYLAAGCIGREEEFFWDELERIFLAPGLLPPQLKIQLGERIHSWDTRPAERYYPADAEKHGGWRVSEPAPTVRQTIYRTLCEFVRHVPPGAQRQVMDQVRQWAGGQKAARPSHRTLSRQEAVELAGAPGVEIGAHTVHHPFLADLPLAEQKQEITRSKAVLESLIGRPVRSFSYPYGSSDSFTDQTAALVKEAGFLSAATTLGGAVDEAGNLMRLPRCIVRNWDGIEFEERLGRWFIDG